MQETQHELYDQQDEISLIDLIQILWKRRILIIGGTLLATVRGRNYQLPFAQDLRSLDHL